MGSISFSQEALKMGSSLVQQLYRSYLFFSLNSYPIYVLCSFVGHKGTHASRVLVIHIQRTDTRCVYWISGNIKPNIQKLFWLSGACFLFEKKKNTG